MEITRVITKMAAGSNSSVWQDLLLLSRQNEFSDLPAGCCRQSVNSNIGNHTTYFKRCDDDENDLCSCRQV